ncbi:tyrosine-type recombinase/integrase [Dictyobacter formicarum]|uniref:Transposase n=1 Tax=Dictyobacter formicarum TaxID=2778368 RepID=A0ABQ3VJH4_9CHLR|nr:tyrosine-type recombinase/integrase [Dictyobacter formicarum]GHO86062.1 transposase [Dictyobacter formicarum]
MEGTNVAPRMIAADVPDRGRMYYLVDSKYDFIPYAKEFLDWKAATKRAPATVKAYCSRLLWYYHFLTQRNLNVHEVTSADLTEFVIWLCNPYRDVAAVSVIHQPSPLQATSVNLILQVVGAFYHFLVRRGMLTESPVRYVDVPRGKWLAERDLLAHTQRGQAVVQRMELKLKEPDRLPPIVSEQDFQIFVNSIHLEKDPNGDPAGFRDRLLCLMLKEGGFRIGELLGMRMEDLEFGKQGVHVRFRSNNENGARAKAGYGNDRFVHLPTDVLGLLDVYITEVWIEANPRTDHLWIVLKKEAKNREGQSTYGTALTVAAVEKVFQHYSEKSGVFLHPHVLRHTHVTALVRSYLQGGEPVDWKFIQERLGHASVVTTMQIYTHLTKEDHKLAYERYSEKRKKGRANR